MDRTNRPDQVKEKRVLVRRFSQRRPLAYVAGVLTTAIAALAIAASSAAPALAKTTGSKCSGNTTVKVGYVPSLTVIAMLVGQKTGVFKKYCLTVKPVLITSPANSYPELLAGQVNVLDGSALITASFAGNGAPINIIGGLAVESTNSKNNWWQVISLKSDKSVTSLKSIAQSGGSIGVGQLNSFTTLGIQNELAKEGLSPNAIKFVVIPTENQLAALEAGEVDAIYAGQPYLTQDEQVAKVKTVWGGAPVQNLPVDAWTATKSYESSNSKAIKELQEAIPIAYAAVASNAALARRLAAQSLDLTKATAAAMKFPPYVKAFPVKALDQAENLEVKYGYIKAAVPNSQLLDLK